MNAKEVFNRIASTAFLIKIFSFQEFLICFKDMLFKSVKGYDIILSRKKFLCGQN